MKVLYLNACIGKASRTKELADYLIQRLNGNVKEIVLEEVGLHPLSQKMLEERAKFIRQRDFSHPIFDFAKEFVSADEIVVAAPYWDLSFPASLKIFVEHINILNLVFSYSSKGEVVPLCKAKKLYYVTTKGGYHSDDFGFGYLKALCDVLYGIKESVLIKAEGLDIQGADVAALLNVAKKRIDDLF